MSFHLRLGLSGILVFMLSQCEINSPRNPDDTGNQNGQSENRIQLFTSASGRVSAAQNWNMDSLVMTLSVGDTMLDKMVIINPTEWISLPPLPVGSQCHVGLIAFRKDMPLFSGETGITLDPTRKQPIQMVLHPLFGRIQVPILLPALEEPVSTGQMHVSSPSTDWQGSWARKGSLAILSLDTLPVGNEYRIEIQLCDSLLNVVYTGKADSIAVLPGKESQLEIKLTPTQVRSTLSVQWSTSAATQLTVTVPAQKRAVKRVGELQWTKVYPIPSQVDSGAGGEWLEIFNATSDTLELDGCKVSRDRQSGDTRAFGLDGFPPLAPGKVITFGHAHSPAEFMKPSFSLVNTSATLWLECGEEPLVQDTLRYSSTRDSTGVTVREGEILLRKPTQLGGLSKPEDWCTRIQDSVPGGFRVHPGSIFSACSEN